VTKFVELPMFGLENLVWILIRVMMDIEILSMGILEDILNASWKVIGEMFNLHGYKSVWV
jgi:hypothetical protein